MHGDRRLQFAVAQDLDGLVAAYYARLLKHLGCDFGLAQSCQTVQIHDVVFLAENVGEAALRHTPVQRHLAAFEPAYQPRTRTGPLPLVAARRSLAHAGPHAASDSLLLFR